MRVCVATCTAFSYVKFALLLICEVIVEWEIKALNFSRLSSKGMDVTMLYFASFDRVL